jgi:hypothetical protein
MRQAFTSVLTVTLLAIVLVLAGCSGLGGKKGGIVQTPLHVGQEGLSLAFLPNLPPAKLYAPEQGEELTFDVGATLMNKGAYDIIGGYLALGLERDYVSFKSWNLEGQGAFSQIDVAGQRVIFNLLGRSQLDPQGEQAIVTATVSPLPIDPLTEQHKTTTIMTACYPYMTEASAPVCIETDIYGMKPVEKVCKAGTVSLGGGQGAPVAVTKVEQRTLSERGEFVRPQFLIHVRNLGRGTVVRTDKVETACSSQPLNASEINVVHLEELSFSEFSLTGGHFECLPAEIRLKAGEGFAKCTLRPELLTTERQTYSTSLFIRLRYGYFQTIAQDVLLERLLPY